MLLQLIPAVAKQQGTVADAMIAMAMAPIAAFATGKGADSVKALDGIASFIADWKKPKGPITISVAPAKGVNLADFGKIEQPNALAEVFGLKVDYAGTRAGAAGAGTSSGGQAAAPAPPAVPPPATPPAGARTLTGPEAWLSIIGNTVTGKIDDKVIFEHAGTARSRCSKTARSPRASGRSKARRSASSTTRTRSAIR